jgi:hypothetical protein
MLILFSAIKDASTKNKKSRKHQRLLHKNVLGAKMTSNNTYEGPFGDLAQSLLWPWADPLCLFNRDIVGEITNLDMLWSSNDDYNDDEEDENPLAYVKWIANLQMPRACGTYEYAGEFMNAIDGTCADP